MKFKNFIIFILTLMIFGFDGSYQSNDDEMVTELKTYDNSTDNSTESVKFVAVGESGTVLTSSDGTSWTSRTSGTTNDLNGVPYGNSTFLTVDFSGTILISSDGTSWTTISGQTSMFWGCLLYTSPSPRDATLSRMPSSA